MKVQDTVIACSPCSEEMDMRSNPKYPSISTKSLLERRRKQQTAMKMNPDIASLALISKDDPFSEWGSLQANL
jgi:hypothetical protein